ncbi:MAG: FadR/GntR family transcriptional regulator [Spirochaetales bacterium]
MPGKVKRVTTPEAVVEYIKEKIREGIYKPGDPLPSERVLIQELEISRLSLREGLARLRALGIIRVKQGKGAVVSDRLSPEVYHDILFPILNSPDSKSFQDLFEARIVLESRFTARAAEIAGAEDIHRLEENLERFASALEDVQRFAEIDLLFHREIERIAKNSILSIMKGMIQKTIEDFIRINVKDADVRQKALQDHRDILDAIRQHLPSLAAERMEQHIRRSETDYRTIFCSPLP